MRALNLPAVILGSELALGLTIAVNILADVV